MSTVVVGILITIRIAAVEVKEDPDLRLEVKRFESRILILSFKLYTYKIPNRYLNHKHNTILIFGSQFQI